MRIRIELMVIILGFATLTTAAQGTKPGLLAEVIATKQTVRLGEPIVVSVRVTNQTSEVAVVSRSAMQFDCFEVTGPDGNQLLYIGFDGQAAETLTNVPPFSSATLAEALDLTEKYLFQKPGRYSVRLRDRSLSGLTATPLITIEITPGQLAECDEVVATLLQVCPAGWRVVKDGCGEVAPDGRSPSRGFSIHLCHDHIRGEAVLLWFTKQEAKVDPEQQPRGKVEYLGRARGLYVYASVGENTPPLWPTAIEDISRVLQITKQQ